MKLSEIQQIQEIEKIPQIEAHNIDLAAIKDTKIVKTQYLNDYFIEECKIEDQLVYCVRCIDGDRTTGHKLVAVLVCNRVDDLDLSSGKKVVCVKRTWCEKEFRNKGLITNLYRFLYMQLKFAIIADIQQTPETVAIWNKLKTYWPVKMIDFSTGQITDIDDSILYDKSKKFSMIIERYELPTTSPLFRSQEIPNGILEDYIFESAGY